MALENVLSMQRSFWSEKHDGSERFGKVQALLTKADITVEGLARLLIYIEDPKKPGVMNKVTDNSNFVWTGTLAGSEPNLEFSRKNTFVIVSGNDSSGRQTWQERVTAQYAASTGKVEVIGYDYSSYDKLQIDDGYTCSFDLLTGTAKAATVNKAGSKPRKVSPIKSPVDLNQWTESSRPKDCIPQPI